MKAWRYLEFEMWDHEGKCDHIGPYWTLNEPGTMYNGTCEVVNVSNVWMLEKNCIGGQRKMIEEQSPEDGICKKNDDGMTVSDK